MNVGRYVWGSVIVFIYLLIIEWIFHGLIMSGTYNQAIELLRPQSDVGTYTIWMLIGFLILAFGFCFIFVKGYEGRGVGEGIRYGFYVSVSFLVSTYLINFAIFPYPVSWLIAWIIGEVIIMIFAGVIIAAIYRKPALPAPPTPPTPTP